MIIFRALKIFYAISVIRHPNNINFFFATDIFIRSNNIDILVNLNRIIPLSEK